MSREARASVYAQYFFFELPKLRLKCLRMMTKITIQLLEKGTDSLKSKLDTLTQDFQALKVRLEKKEPTGRTSQDGGPSFEKGSQ